MLLVVIGVRSLFKFAPANCSAQTQSLSVAICSPLDLDVMASSSFPAGAAVKFWVPNLTTGLPDYSECVKSGLWARRRRLRVCGGTGETAYMLNEMAEALWSGALS